MPELPEVETTTRGLAPHITQQIIAAVNIYRPNLRWPIPSELKKLVGQSSGTIERRAKYMLWHFDSGTVVMHLGMSGSMRIVDADSELKKHDHFEVIFNNGKALRFNDPRRFGAVLWQPQGEELSVIKALGPEPLTDDFNGDYLYQKLKTRKGAIKNAIMTNAVVVGVGNIYASESLFLSGIHPKRAANRVSHERCHQLVKNIKRVLAKAIAQGGTTLKDFTQADGSPGYFAQELNVYGRTDEPCLVCQTPIKNITLGQRSSFYCPRCQK